MRGRSQAFPGGVWPCQLQNGSYHTSASPVKFVKSRIFTLHGEDETGPASRFGGRQLAPCRDDPPPRQNSQGIPELLGGGENLCVCGRRGGDEPGWTLRC